MPSTNRMPAIGDHQRGRGVKATLRLAVAMAGTLALSPAIALAAPNNITPPTITGTPEVGNTLTCAAGTWTGTNPGDSIGPIDYEWYYASSLRAPFYDGGTNPTYTPVTADVGKALVCVEVEMDFTDGTNAIAESDPSAPVAALSAVTITRFSTAVSGNIGSSVSGVTVSLTLNRATGSGSATAQVATATAVTDAGGAWSATLTPVNPTGGPPNAFGAPGDTLTASYAPPAARPATTVPPDFTYSEATLAGGFFGGASGVQFEGLESSISADGSTLTGQIAGPDCTSFSFLIDGAQEATSAGSGGPCTLQPASDVTDADHVQAAYTTVISDDSGDRSTVTAIDDVGLPGTGAVGPPTCTADLVFDTVTCVNLDGGNFAVTRNGGTPIALTSVQDSTGVFTGSAPVPGLGPGDTITLDETSPTATTRHLTTLNVYALRVDLGSGGHVLSGTCQPNKVMLAGGLCQPDGTVPTAFAGTALFDDLSGGSTIVSVPHLSDLVPTVNDSMSGTDWGSYADMSGPGTAAQIFAATRSISFQVVPEDGGAAVFDQDMFVTTNSAGAFATVTVDPLSAGRYVATWLLTDANGDTQAYSNLFVQQPGGSGGGGPPGPPGPTGNTGPAGPVGSTGANGTTGASGPAGSDGATGATGIGSPGPDGATGPSGSAGPAGPAGANGPPGHSGATGPAGTEADGPPGPPGPAGAAGPAGINGADGADGTTGPAGANGANGANGISELTKCAVTKRGHKRTKTVCTVTQLNPGAQTVNIRIARAGTTVAAGVATVHHGVARVPMGASHSLPPGRYTLVLVVRDGRHTVVRRLTVRIT